MEPELEKLVESRKLSAKGAEQLEKLKPGTFCLHKSWGFGRIVEWNLLLNQILIDFAGKKAHPMQLQYAAENLTVIPAEHFLVRKAGDLAATKSWPKMTRSRLSGTFWKASMGRQPRNRSANGWFPIFLMKPNGNAGGNRLAN